MIRNEELLQLREAYIEIGKMVEKYGYGQYNGILRILMGQVNCIDSDAVSYTHLDVYKRQVLHRS